MRYYVSRFQKEAQDIPHLEFATSVEAFKIGLNKDSSFYEEWIFLPKILHGYTLLKNWGLCRVNALEDGEGIKYYPKIPNYCFSVNVSYMVCTMQDHGDKQEMAHKE